MGKNFELDTGNMVVTAEHCQKLSAKMFELQQTLNRSEISLVNSWMGEGSKEFQKCYERVLMQLKDIKTGLDDLATDIMNACDTYIQTDIDTAKRLEGITSQQDLRNGALDTDTTVAGSSASEAYSSLNSINIDSGSGEFSAGTGYGGGGGGGSAF